MNHQSNGWPMKNLMQLKNTKAILNLLLMVGLVSLFTVGCGDSRKDFVHTGNYVTPDTGDLLFFFDTGLLAQGVTAPAFPAGSESVRFDFFGAPDDGSLGAFIFHKLYPVASEILVENVPNTVKEVRVTALDANGFPLGVSSAEITTVPGMVANVVMPAFSTQITYDALNTIPNNIELDIDSDAVTLETSATFILDGYGSYDVPVSHDDLVYSVTDVDGAITFDHSTGEVSFANKNLEASILVSYTVGGVVWTDTVDIKTVGPRFEASAEVLRPGFHEDHDNPASWQPVTPDEEILFPFIDYVFPVYQNDQTMRAIRYTLTYDGDSLPLGAVVTYEIVEGADKVSVDGNGKIVFADDFMDGKITSSFTLKVSYNDEAVEIPFYIVAPM